jgi:hypothetical protein
MGSTLARRAAAVALVVSLALALPGPAGATGATAGAGGGPAAAAVGDALAALVGPGPAPAATVAALPRYRQVMGYTPAAAILDGDPGRRAVKADGACSSPLGATWFDFGLACKAHDLGYDLLRYADRVGAPLGPDARRLLDDRFALDLDHRCEATRRGAAEGLCKLLGRVYAGAARLNSWRQGYGRP